MQLYCATLKYTRPTSSFLEGSLTFSTLTLMLEPSLVAPVTLVPSLKDIPKKILILNVHLAHYTVYTQSLEILTAQL